MNVFAIRNREFEGLPGKEKNQPENGKFDHKRRHLGEEKRTRFPGAPGEMPGWSPEHLLQELQVDPIAMESRAGAQHRQTIFDAINDGLALLDLEGRVLCCNRAMEKLLARPSKELLGRRCWDLLPGTTGPIEVGPVRRTWKSGRRENQVLCLGERWIEVTADPVLDKEGRLIGTIHIIADITRRKRAEEALRKSKGWYHLVEDYNYDWEYWQDEDQTFLFCSPPCLWITGYAPKDFYNDPNLLNKLIHPEDRSIIEKHNNQFPQGNEIANIDFRLIDRLGRLHWIDHYCQSVIDFAGKPFGRRATNRDITTRKQAEEALKFSEEKLSKAFRASPDWMTISTLEEDRYVDVNDAFVELSGFSREEALGKNRVELGLWVDPREGDRAGEIIRKEGELKNFEAKVRLKSGEVRTMLWSAETFDLEGQKYVTTVNRDITELRMAQEKLEQTMENYRRALVGKREALAITTEARDPHTAGHQRRVAKLARDITKEMGLSEDQANGLSLA